MKKTCARCGIEKDVNEFYHNFMYKDTYSNICKECSKLATRKWAEENKDRKAELNKRYYERKKAEFERGQEDKN